MSCETPHNFLFFQVVSLMLPLRYDFWQFGGSWASGQVFNVTLIHAAIRADQHSLALALVAELKVVAATIHFSISLHPSPSPPLPSPPLPQAQKPKNRQLSKLFEQLKTIFDRQQQSLEPAAKKIRLDSEK